VLGSISQCSQRDGMAIAKTWCHLTVDGLREQIKLEGRTQGLFVEEPACGLYKPAHSRARTRMTVARYEV
jgi:hypothetical protein